jgi:hypothetical protein
MKTEKWKHNPMIPVQQTDFSTAGGNCYAACVASLLELPIERVPNFHREHGAGWVKPFCHWLKDFGLWPCVVSIEKSDQDAKQHLDHAATAIAGGLTKSKCSHACIYQGQRLLWDPFPGGIGLDVIEDLTFLIPIKFQFSGERSNQFVRLLLQGHGWSLQI